MEKSFQIEDGNRERMHEEITDQVTKMLKAHMRPEFINRIDDIIVFHSLTKDEIKHIVRLSLNGLNKLLKDKDLSLELSPEAEDYLVQHGYDPAFGARPLKRLVQKQIVNALALKLLEGSFTAGEKILVVEKENSLDFISKKE